MASFHFIRLRLCAMRVEVFSLHRLLTCTSILVEDDDVVVVAFEALFGTTMSKRPPHAHGERPHNTRSFPRGPLRPQPMKDSQV